MSTEIRKFKSLDLDQKYQVHGYDGPYESNFGYYYALFVSEEESNEVFKIIVSEEESFEVFATSLIFKHILEKYPKKKLCFTPEEKNGVRDYAIEGYII